MTSFTNYLGGYYEIRGILFTMPALQMVLRIL